MAWYLVAIGLAVPFVILFVRWYLRDKQLTAHNQKFCYNCKKSFNSKYVLCPDCGLKFGV